MPKVKLKLKIISTLNYRVITLAIAFVVHANAFSKNQQSALRSSTLRNQYAELFRKFPIKKTPSKNKRANLKIESHREGIRYEKILRAAYKQNKAPNFAGQYILVDQIDCGRACRMIFIINIRNGTLMRFPRETPVEFNSNSRLIIANPIKNSKLQQSCDLVSPLPELYDFDGESFKVVNDTVCPRT